MRREGETYLRFVSAAVENSDPKQPGQERGFSDLQIIAQCTGKEGQEPGGTN